MSMDVHWMPTDVHGSMTPLKYPFVHVDPLNHSFPDKTPEVQQINQKFNQTINPTIIIKYTQGYFFFLIRPFVTCVAARNFEFKGLINPHNPDQVHW